MSESKEDFASLIPDFPPLRRVLETRGDAATMLAEPLLAAAPLTAATTTATATMPVPASIEPFEKAPPVSGRLGKETKIGLALVGSLLTTFGGLLVYRFVDSTAADLTTDKVHVAAFSGSANATNEKPTLVAARHDHDEEAAPVDRWKRNEPSNVPTRAADDFPPANFLPSDRYAAIRGDDIPNQLNELADETAASNPFAAGSTTVDDEAPLEPIEPVSAPRYRDSDIPPADPEPNYEPRQKNPLRRMSNEQPIDEPLGLSDPDGPAWATRDVFEEEPLPRRPVPPRDPGYSAPPMDDRTADLRDGQLPRYRQEPVDRPLARNVPPADPPANGKHIVGPNDSLWTISEKAYGTGGYFKALAEYNKFNLPNPNRLNVGSQVSVPPASVLDQKYPSLVPKQRKSALVEPRTIQASARGRVRGENTYVVEQGDTLFDIARYELGKASRWGEIYDLNRDKLSQDFDYLQPGTVLNMPSKNPPDNMTRNQDAGWQR